MMRARIKPFTSIRYTIIIPPYDLTRFLPQTFLETKFDKLKRLPTDFVQIYDPILSYKTFINSPVNFGISIGFLVEKDVIDYIEDNYFKDHPILDVFYIENYPTTFFDVIQNFKNSYFISSFDDKIIELIIKDYPQYSSKLFSTSKELINLINDEKEDILKQAKSFTSKDEIDFYAKIVSEKKYDKTISKDIFNFIPAYTNVSILNQITGLYWNEDINYVDHDNKNRQQCLIKYAKLIDNYYKANKFVFFDSYNNLLINPLFIILPFSDIKLRNSFDEMLKDKQLEKQSVELTKRMRKSYQLEQNIQYMFEFKYDSASNFSSKEMSSKLFKDNFIQYNVWRLSFLDTVGYLNATINYSPVIRLPQLSNSVYSFLSYLDPHNYSKRKDFKKVHENINNIGKKIKELTITDELEEYLLSEERQIVTISDLPLEWITLSDVPLTFLFDVCRIPESPLPGLMNSYVSNNHFEYSIPKNILEKTLIIFGFKEDSKYFLLQKLLETNQGLHKKIILKKCQTVKEVVEAIDTFKPELLVFDCHGNYDADNLSSYLLIGDEILTGIEIQEFNIVAPMIFLSCCQSSPINGYINNVVNAFLSNGAISIVSTFLPVYHNSSTALYVRLLQNLELVTSEGIHKNWLSYVSHIVRTSLTYNILEFIGKKVKKRKQFVDKFFSKMPKWQIETMSFRKRSRAYTSWKNIVFDSLDKDDKERIGNNINFETIFPEHLFYTHIGRPDLILFDSWKEKNTLSNQNMNSGKDK